MNVGVSARISQPRRREHSIGAVLDSAQHLFVSQGYHGTTMERIAKRAGLTKAAIYFYFDDKRGLLNVLLDRVEERIYRPLLEEMQRGELSATDRLVTFLHRQAVLGGEDAEMLLLPVVMSKEFSGSGDPAERRVQALYGRIYAALEQVVGDGQASGEFAAHAPPAEQASIIAAVHDGMLLEWLRRGRGDHLDGPTVVRAMRLTVLDGVRGHAAGEPSKRGSNDG
jgi:TetR/AcrR family transcriptional regulator, transcriptional repressor for nem operon